MIKTSASALPYQRVSRTRSGINKLLNGNGKRYLGVPRPLSKMASETALGCSTRLSSSSVVREDFGELSRAASFVYRPKNRADGIWRMAYGRLHMSRRGT